MGNVLIAAVLAIAAFSIAGYNIYKVVQSRHKKSEEVK